MEILQRSEQVIEPRVRKMFQDLATKIAKERHLLPQHAAVLLEQYQKGLSMITVKENSDEIIAHATLWPLIDKSNWYELGTVWVDPQHRGKNLMTDIYRKIFENNNEKNILLTTTNPIAMKISLKTGMVLVLRDELPSEVVKASCICSLEKTKNGPENCCLALTEKKFCPESEKCHFFITENTASRLNIQTNEN